MKNKLLALLTVGFALLFITFVVRITDDMSKSHINILNSTNVIDVTDLISTQVHVTNEDLPMEGNWTLPDFRSSNWYSIKIPSYKIVQLKDFKEGHFAYYRIKIPKVSFDKLKHLQRESAIALQSVYFSRIDITINGKFYGTNKPIKSNEAKLNLPVIEDQDNYICLKGFIQPGDTGIDHRGKIMLGKAAELNEIHRASYKAQTVFQLVFILCKGSILFIFALIYLLLKVDTSFEKFFIFGFCAVLEELIAGDYFYGPLNFNQMVYFYNAVNIGAAISVFFFFAELLNRNYSIRVVRSLSFVLIVISSILATDALYWNYLVDISNYMRFWNLMTVSILIFYVPQIFKFDRILFFGLLMSTSLYLWGTLPSSNIGLNFKTYGNLLLFFMVAYQTFALFRREQDLLQIKERQLLEQEKDVAIGQTASLLAHDVRKPLEQMKLVMDKIMSGDASKEFLEIAKKDIDFSIAGVDRQVNDIMNFNKTNVVSLSEVSFYKLLAHSVKQVMSVHQEMNLVIELRFEANMKVLGESSRLSGALVNLISNAVEAIRDIGNNYNGKIRFTSYIQNSEFIFKIFNDGPEIPKGVIDNIFKPLFTHGKASGTGLGLASVVKTINEHQGSINVANVQGGVEFTLTLIVGANADDFNNYEFRHSSKDYGFERSNPILIEMPELRVLLLDHDPVSIKHYETSLEILNYNVKLEVATNQELAEVLIRKSRFDIYLMNVDSGGMTIYQNHLSFLSSEVVLYSALPIQNLNFERCTYIPHLASVERLIDVFEKVYPQRLKVLFVDDTKLFRVAWQMYHGNHNIKCVASPEEALHLLSDASEEYGAYILDYHFSNSSLNGEHLAKRILDIRLNANILISSNVDQKIECFKSISKRDYEVRKLL